MASPKRFCPDENGKFSLHHGSNEPGIIVLEKDKERSLSPTEKHISCDEFDNEEIIMSAYWRNGKFAAAYFDIRTSELSILNEISDVGPEFPMLKAIYRQTQPMILVVDSRASKVFTEAVKSLIIEKDPDSSTSSNMRINSKLQAGLQILPNKEYNFESCQNRIYELSLPNEPPDASESERENFLNSTINFRYVQTIHAMGALLKYLDKNWNFFNAGNNSSLSVLALNIVSLEKIVTMNDESYKALQIFNKMSHPSNFKRGTSQSGKEGLSLFGIFNLCCSKIGAQYLKLLLQQPTNDVKVLQRRSDTISFCCAPGNEEIIKRLCSSLRHIKNVNGIMTRIKALRANPCEWKLLFNTLYNAVLICELCESYKDSSSLMNALGCRNNDNLFQVAHHMHQVIDFELSAMHSKFTVRPGIDPELDKKKKLMESLHDMMSKTARYELEKLPEYVEECTMVYLPNLGYLLGVKMWKPDLSREEKNIPFLKFMFQNDNCIYYKSPGCEELDHCIGDTYPEILAEEMKIMMRLTKFILKHLHPLSSVIKLCAELDAIISIAKVCKANDYRKPILTFEKTIEIIEGRHPLQELCVKSHVPNSTRSSNSDGLVTILTGPNSCGKSIYLKQVALITYMAHIGSFVPAKSATIGLIDQIYTRVQTNEDISTRMSAFLIDLRQISQAVVGSTQRSLIIIDEFGKGTTEVDGLGLLASCVNSFLFRDENCPHIFVSTHFHQLNEYLIQSNLLKLMSMEYSLQNGKLLFLYKLIEGVTKKSFAHEVAETAGIDKRICKRARDILENLQDHYPKADETLVKCALQRNIVENMTRVLGSQTHQKNLIREINCLTK